MDWDAEHAFHRNRLQYLAFVIHDKYKKSLKIPTGLSESVYRRRSDNRYQRGNQNPYIEEGLTAQGPKENVQKDKQRSTKHTHKTKDWVTGIPLKTGGELRCSGRVSSSCSTDGTRRVILVTNPLISNAWGKDREVLTTSGTYPWSVVTQIFYSGQPKVVCCFGEKQAHFKLAAMVTLTSLICTEDV
jgi:hypothetical protein